MSRREQRGGDNGNNRREFARRLLQRFFVLGYEPRRLACFERGENPQITGETIYSYDYTQNKTEGENHRVSPVSRAA
jgi:hypothetical protein